jgi:flavin reductase (DIM6/NTAB) family NADH-FMN oxidoreductase RutF
MIGFTSLSSVSLISTRFSRDDFRRACSNFATGVAVITVVADDGTLHGLTVNSFASVSAEPPLILVCIDLRCRVLSHFLPQRSFGISFLSEHQRNVSARFAELPEGRFDGVNWTAGMSGAPLLEGALGTLECIVANRIDAGDHVIVIGEVIALQMHTGHPLLYFRSTYQQLSKCE